MTDWVSAPPYGIAVWKLNPTNVIVDPGVNEFRADSITAPTALAVSETDRAGDSREDDVFAAVVAGDRLVLQQQRAATRYFVFDVGTPVDHGVWWELPVTVVDSSAAFVDGQDYVFLFRHAELVDTGDEEDTATVSPPAPLVPGSVYEDLVADVVTALLEEVNGDPVRDADKADRAARSSIEDVTVHLDADGGPDQPVYPDLEALPARVFGALVDLAAVYLKRPGFAYGVAGYDDADPLAVRARGAILSALTPGLKRRWGVA